MSCSSSVNASIWQLYRLYYKIYNRQTKKIYLTTVCLCVYKCMCEVIFFLSIFLSMVIFLLIPVFWLLTFVVKRRTGKLWVQKEFFCGISTVRPCGNHVLEFVPSKGWTINVFRCDSTITEKKEILLSDFIIIIISFICFKLFFHVIIA